MPTVTIGSHSKIAARRTDQALNTRITDFGVHRIEMPGAEHLYFQAPGGQVFRVVKRNEDLSRFER